MKHIILNIILTLYVLFIAGGYLIGAKPLIVTSNSMAPAVSKGDLVIVLKDEQYKVGDIISFGSKEEIITHRIIDAANNVFKTKGDANKLLDFGSIKKSNILGKVKFVIPLLGFLFMSLQSKYFAYFLLILVVYLLFEKVQNVKK